MWKDVKKAFPLGLDKNGNPNCPECRKGIELAGMLPTFCGYCGALRSAENWQEKKKGDLNKCQ
jgi:hypothetical protein